MATRYLRFFLLFSAGCTPPAQATPGTPPALYVASAVERTLVPLEATSGRPGGTPLRLEVAPEQVAPGPDGGLLLLSTTGGDGILTFLSSATLRASAGTHRGRAITLGRLPLSAIPRLASDGVRFAAVLSVTAEPGALRDCRLALVDVRTGAVRVVPGACAPGERPVGLAFASSAGAGRPQPGPLVYLALAGPVGGRVVALDGATGTARATLSLVGTPMHLLRRDGAGDREDQPGVVVVQRIGGPEQDPPTPATVRLLELDATTLRVDRVLPLQNAPDELRLAPDGRHVYIRTDHSIYEVDLDTGSERWLATVPDRPAALAAAGRWVYVATPDPGAIWAIDTAGGRPRRILSVPQPLAFIYR